MYIIGVKMFYTAKSLKMLTLIITTFKVTYMSGCDLLIV